MTYRSAHHALICAFVPHDRPAHSSWQDQYDPSADRKSRNSRVLEEPDEVGMHSAALLSALHGMEEVAGEAANVLKHLARMSDTPAAVLILKTCPPRQPHHLLREEATVPHPLYRAAVRWLGAESLAPVGGLEHETARQDAVRRACGAKVNVGITADKCGVSRDTIERLNAKVKKWIGPIEDRAWREIEDRLQAAGLIEVELA